MAATKDDRRRLVLAPFVLWVLAVGCTAQDPSSISSPSPSSIMIGRCELLIPRELVSGATPGSAMALGPGRFQWGVGEDSVFEAVGEFEVGDPESLGVPPGSPQRVTVRGAPAIIVPIGDEGIGQFAITWRSGDCPYTLWLPRGTTLERAADYAGRF